MPLVQIPRSQYLKCVKMTSFLDVALCGSYMYLGHRLSMNL